MLHGRAVVPGAARAMRPNASSARRPRSARGPVAHGTSTRQNMPAWLLCRRERPARRDDGHGGGAGARVGPPGVHRLRDVGDGRAVALRKERGQALRSGTIGATARPRHGQERKSHLRTPQRCTYALVFRGHGGIQGGSHQCGSEPATTALTHLHTPQGRAVHPGRKRECRWGTYRGPRGRRRGRRNGR